MIGKLTESSQLRGNLSSGTNQAVEYTAGTGIDITENVISNTITSYNDLEDKPTIPQELTTSVYHDTFTHNTNDYTIDYAVYGNLIDLEINAPRGNYSTQTNYVIYTLPENIRPSFEVCVPIMSYGYVSGVSWITTDGEVNIRFSTFKDNTLFRLHIAYLKQ